MSIQNTFSDHWIVLSLSEEAIFSRFIELFREYNAHTNLSAIRDDVGIIEKHFVDSLMIERFASLHGRVLDIGTGGWFPGIPLAIRHPEVAFVLLDSVGKKVRACDHFVQELGLSNISTIHGRAEEVVSSSLRGTISRSEKSNGAILCKNITQDHRASLHSARDDDYRETFDFVVSRATAYLPQILEWSLPFLSSGGQIVLYKLPSEEERRDGMKAAKTLGLKLIREESYVLTGQERILLFFAREQK